MKKLFVFSCAIIILTFIFAGVVYSQSLEEIREQVRNQVRSEMGVDQPQQQQRYVQKVDVTPGRTKIQLIHQAAIILIALAFIPATIAKLKGRSFIAWWVLGLFGFIVAFPISVYIKKLSKTAPKKSGGDTEEEAHESDIYSKIESLSKLKEKGIISQDEYESKKKELLLRI